MNIVGRRKWYYAISLALIVPGIIFLLTSGLRLGIDFKGGSLIEARGTAPAEQIRLAAEDLGLKDVTVTPSGGDSTLIRYRDEGSTEEQDRRHQDLKARLAALGLEETRFDSVGPSVSRDITRNAFISIALASLAIVLYIAFAFRNVPPPMTSYNFGVVAIVALLHDALFVIGTFSILGALAGVEIDALFVTAVLTVIGFSVHDTIVVFDRIRENLRRQRGSFEEVVNNSILETMARSLNTSLTVLLTLLALLLFGGETIRYFVLALLIGIASGTYSSIFTAAPMLVSWHNYKQKHPKK
jgi:preprotein translocase subunit SecF